jgi:hypothetical protein
MALNFSTSTLEEFSIIVSCDSSVKMTDEQRATYLNHGTLDGVQVDDDATWFKLKPLSANDRERAEIRAGAFTRSELGKLLWVEAPSNTRDRARWHNKLDNEEREALASYEQYQNKCYCEYIREGLIAINDEPATFDMIDTIKPSSDRITTISEIVYHLHRVSLLSDAAK